MAHRHPQQPLGCVTGQGAIRGSLERSWKETAKKGEGDRLGSVTEKGSAAGTGGEVHRLAIRKLLYQGVAFCWSKMIQGVYLWLIGFLRFSETSL